MTILLLGPLEVTDSDANAVAVTRRMERVALGALAVRAGSVVPADALVDALWGDEAPPNAVELLRPPISRLRTVLRRAGSDDRTLAAVGGGYVLNLGPADYDVAAAERLAGDAEQAAAAGRHERAAELLRRASGLWRGAPLGDMADEPFARLEVARLNELHNTIVENRVEADLAIGRHGALAAELPGLVHAEPYREVRWAQWMRALYRCGRQTEALRVYGQLRTFLGDELGIEPVPWIRALEAAMLRQSPELEWQPAVQRHASRGRACTLRARPASAFAPGRSTR